MIRVLLRILRTLAWAVARALYLVYLLVFRSFLYVTTLAVVVYFAVNSSYFRVTLVEVIAAEIPGRIKMTNLQWGPLPWQARIVGVDITEPGGASVITADAVYGEVDLPDLLGWLSSTIVLGGAPFRISITGADVRDYSVDLDMLEHGTPLLAFAFDDMQPSKPGGKPATVRIRNGNGVRGACELHIDGIEQRYEDIDFAGYSMDVGADGLHMHAPLLTFRRGKLVLAEAVSPVPGKPFELWASDARVVDWRWDEARDGYSVEAVDFDVPGGHLTVRGSMAFPHGAPVGYDAEARLDLDEGSPLIPTVTEGRVRGAASLWVRGRGDFDAVATEVQLVSPALVAKGIPVEGLRIQGELLPGPNGPMIRVPTAELGVLGGRILLSDALLDAGTLEVEGLVRLFSVSPVELLTSPLIGMDASELRPFEGSVTGDVQVRTLLGEELEVTADILGRPLVVDLDAPLSGVPLEQQLLLEGGVTVAVSPSGATLAARSLVLHSGEDVLGMDGSLAFPSLTLDAAAELTVPNLHTFVAAAGYDGVRGALSVTGIRVKGPILSPTVESADFLIRGGHVDSLSLGKVQGAAQLRGGVLLLEGVRAQTELGALGLDGQVTLFNGDLTRLSVEMPFEVSKLRVDNVPVSRLLKGRTGTLSLGSVRARGELRDPLGTLETSGHVVVTGLGAVLQPLERLEADVKLDRSRVDAEDVLAVLPNGERIRASGVSYDLEKGTLRARVRTDAITLEKLAALRTVEAPLGGVVSADLEISGRQGDLDVKGTAAVTGFRYGDIVLGDATFGLHTDEQGAVQIASALFFRGWELLDGSSVLLAKSGVPVFLQASVRFRDQELFDILPDLRLPGVTTKLSGVAEMALDFTAHEDAFGLDFSFEDGDIRATLLDGDLSVTNVGPANLMLQEDGSIWIQDLVLDAGDGVVEVCGTFAPVGGQDLFVRAAARLDFLDVLKDTFSVLEGRVRTAEDPSVEARYGRSCLQTSPVHSHLADVAGAGVVHVAGPLSNPFAEGTIRVDDARARLRSLGTEIRLDPGTAIELRTANEREEPPPRGAPPGTAPIRVADQVLTTPKDRPITGGYDEGTASIAATMRLLRWAPEDLDLSVSGLDIDYASPQEYRVKVNPKLEFRGRRLSSEKARKMDLHGDVVIVEGSYHAGSSIGSSLLKSATGGRKLSAYSKSLTESLPWLGPLGLDVHAAGENFLVRMKMPFGQTDMELRIDTQVRGTLAEPEVYGHIDVLPGGRILNTVVGRDFEVAKAGIDLAGDPSKFYIDSELRTEVTYREERGADSLKGKGELASVSGGALPEEKTVVIRTKIKGNADMRQKGQELQGVEVELESDSGGYDRTELMYLLLTGAPSRQKLDASESTASINLLTGELANVIAKTLLGAFVDTVSLGVTVTGGFDWSFQKSLGRYLKFSVRGVQDDTGQRVQPNFQFKITDQLSLEGSLRFEQGQESQSGQAYETKLRYRIPLD